MKIMEGKFLQYVLSLYQLWLISGAILSNGELVITEQDPLSKSPIKIRLNSSQAEFKKIFEPFLNQTDKVEIFSWQIMAKIFIFLF